MKHKKWYKLFVLIYNSQASRECEDQLCHWWMVDGGWCIQNHPLLIELININQVSFELTIHSLCTFIGSVS